MAVSHNYYRWAKANGKLYNFTDGNCILDAEARLTTQATQV